MSAHHGRRLDDNAHTIVCVLRALGCSVETIQGDPGCPDILVGCFGVTELVEIKPVAKVTARREQRQEAWHSRWQGSAPVVVRTIQDCEALVARLRGARIHKPGET